MKSKFKRIISISIAVGLVLAQWQTLALSAGGKDKAEKQLNRRIVDGKLVVKFKEKKSDVSSDSMQGQEMNSVKIESVSPEKDIQKVIEEYKSNPDVEYVEPMYVRRLIDSVKLTSTDKSKKLNCPGVNPNDPYYAQQWGHVVTEMDKAWSKVPEKKRRQVVVAVIDTGVDLEHEELMGSFYKKGGKIVGYDFANNDTIPDDDYGHGTPVSGIIAAAANNGKGIAGVASGVKIMPIKIFDQTGYSDTYAIARAINFAVDNGADIINMSLGGEDYSQLEQDAINRALRNGITVIAAAGNDSNHWVGDQVGNLHGMFGMEAMFPEPFTMPVSYPAAYEGVVAVGAVDWWDTNENGQMDAGEIIVSDYSNMGNNLDIVAPGTFIVSCFPLELDVNDGVNDGYTSLIGTSLSVPYVSGLAALLKASKKSLRGSDIENILEQSAVKEIVTPDGESNYIGAGMINGKKALEIVGKRK